MAFGHGVQRVELSVGAIVPGGQGEQDAAEEGETCPVMALSVQRRMPFSKCCIKCCLIPAGQTVHCAAEDAAKEPGETLLVMRNGSKHW